MEVGREQCDKRLSQSFAREVKAAVNE